MLKPCNNVWKEKEKSQACRMFITHCIQWKLLAAIETFHPPILGDFATMPGLTMWLWPKWKTHKALHYQITQINWVLCEHWQLATISTLGDTYNIRQSFSKICFHYTDILGGIHVTIRSLVKHDMTQWITRVFFQEIAS